MTYLEDLKPSSADPIPLEVLKALPLPGLYLIDESKPIQGRDHGIVKIEEWDPGHRLMGYRYLENGAWIPGREPAWNDPRKATWRYPKLPRISFSMTTKAISTPGDQPSGRCKSVTRRKRVPKWCKPGALFLAVDKLRFRKDQPPSRGLGCFRVVSAETTYRRNVTPSDLELEGFTDISPSEFWEKLCAAGCVAKDGSCCRISFEAV